MQACRRLVEPIEAIEEEEEGVVEVVVEAAASVPRASVEEEGT